MPWHWQRALLEGLEDEGVISRDGQPRHTDDDTPAGPQFIDLTEAPDF